MEAHATAVAEIVREATRDELQGTEGEVEEWCKTHGPGSIEAQVVAVLAAGGVSDYNARNALVEAAARRQQKLQAERRHRKKDRFKDTAAKALAHEKDGEDSPKPSRRPQQAQQEMASAAQDPLAEAPAGERSGQGAARPAASAPSGPPRTWVEVKTFKTEEEALQFILECQPFDYRPADLPDSWPRVERAREMFERVRQMQPWPSEFVCLHGEQRRLRIRKKEEASENAVKEKMQRTAAMMFKSQRHMLKDMSRRASLLQKEVKAWAVEAAGVLFEPRAPPLRRQLSDGADGGLNRYYVAMAQESADRVLAEGFKVRNRKSIPCSATPQEALEAYRRNSLANVNGNEGTSSPRPRVLSVEIRPELGVEVTPNARGSGLQIRTKALPASCFSRVLFGSSPPASVAALEAAGRGAASRFVATGAEKTTSGS